MCTATCRPLSYASTGKVGSFLLLVATIMCSSCLFRSTSINAGCIGVWDLLKVEFVACLSWVCSC